MSSILATLVHDLGLPGVAIGAGVEGETAVIIGGALARHGAFNPFLAAAAAMLGSFAADQIFFFLGRSQRGGATVTRIAAKPVFDRALRLIERHPVLFCLAFRFVYGFRIAGPVAIGVSRVATGRFVALNAVSATVWAALFTALGWRFGPALERVLRALLTPGHLAAVALLAGIAALIFVVVRRRRTAVAGSG